MSHYENVRVKGLENCKREPPFIEFERFDNGRIQATAGRTKFDITKEQAAKMGAALSRWGRG